MKIFRLLIFRSKIFRKKHHGFDIAEREIFVDNL